MEAVAAVGVAAAAVEFLNFSRETIKLCKEVYDSTDSATKKNAELESRIDRSDKLHHDLDSSVGQSLTGSPRIHTALIECDNVAQDMRKMLEDIRGSTQKTDKLKSAYRAFRRRHTVDRLSQKLDTCQDELQEAISVDIWQRVDAGFDASNKQSQSLQAELRKVYTSLHQEISKSHKDADQALTSAAFISMKDELSRLTIEAQASQERARCTEEEYKVRALLQSLQYPKMFAKHDEARPAHHATYEWMFQRQKQSKTNRHCFIDWLEGPDSVYWICGKAGSGKTTLMKFLAQHKDLHGHLMTWAGQRVGVIKHFFLATGSPEQHNLSGFLKSILYQALAIDHSLYPSISSFAPGQGPAWTIEMLMSAVQLLFRSEPSSGTRFFLFIDGLDEVDGPQYDQDAVLSIVHQASSLTRIKLCVSSRPELQLVDALRSYPKLLDLQHLTLSDMYKYASDKLSSESRFVAMMGTRSDRQERFVNKICYSAQGVFLWLYLAVNDIILGIRSRDTPDMLYRRLDHMGTSLQSLFAFFVGRIQPVHRQKAVSLLIYHKAFHQAGPPFKPQERSVINTALHLDAKVQQEVNEACKAPETINLVQAAALFAALQDFVDTVPVYSGGLLEMNFDVQAAKCPGIDFNGCTCLKRPDDLPQSPLLRIFTHFEGDIRFIHRSAAEFLETHGSAVNLLGSLPTTSDGTTTRWTDKHKQWLSTSWQNSRFRLSSIAQWSLVALQLPPSACSVSVNESSSVLRAWAESEELLLKTFLSIQREAKRSGTDDEQALYSTAEAYAHILARVAEALPRQLIEFPIISEKDDGLSSLRHFLKYVAAYRDGFAHSRCRVLCWLFYFDHYKVYLENGYHTWTKMVANCVTDGAELIDCFTSACDPIAMRCNKLHLQDCYLELVNISHELLSHPNGISLKPVTEVLESPDLYVEDTPQDCTMILQASDHISVSVLLEMTALTYVKSTLLLPEQSKILLAKALERRGVPNMEHLISAHFQVGHRFVADYDFDESTSRSAFASMLRQISEFYLLQRSGTLTEAKRFWYELVRLCEKYGVPSATTEGSTEETKLFKEVVASERHNEIASVAKLWTMMEKPRLAIFRPRTHHTSAPE